MTLTIDLGLYSVVESVRKAFRSKVISLESYCPDIQTETHRHSGPTPPGYLSDRFTISQNFMKIHLECSRSVRKCEVFNSDPVYGQK